MGITGVIHSLSIGGAEKNFATLFNALSARGIKCSVICLADDAATELTLSPEIEVIRVVSSINSDSSRLSKIISAPALIGKLRSAISDLQSDVVLSFMDQTNILTLLALREQKSTPIIVCERNNPARNLILGKNFPELLQHAARMFRNIIYREASLICTQSDGASRYFDQHCPKVRTSVVKNFVAPHHSPSIQAREKLLISVARLVPEKGLEALIKVFAELSSIYPGWRLEIYGEGPDREKLLALIKTLGAEDFIALKGKQFDLAAVYRRSSVFVLNSSYEGFPNALLEAMASGCAVLASNCDFGPAEMIRDGVNGFLVPVGDEKVLKSRLSNLLSDNLLRENLGLEASKIITKYSQAGFVDSFERLLREIAP